MAKEPRTVRTAASVAEFLEAVPDPQRRTDAQAACELMREVTGLEPAMWGPSIVGFGRYRYRYASGREGDWPAVCLSPRKQALTFYLASGDVSGNDRYADLLTRLGPHTTGKGCLYIKRLSDVDLDVLRTLVRDGFEHLDGRTITPEPD